MNTLDVCTTRVALAAGMVSAQADCRLDESVRRMQQHARRLHQTLDETALAVVERRVRFETPATPGPDFGGHAALTAAHRARRNPVPARVTTRRGVLGGPRRAVTKNEAGASFARNLRPSGGARLSPVGQEDVDRTRRTHTERTSRPAASPRNGDRDVPTLHGPQCECRNAATMPPAGHVTAVAVPVLRQKRGGPNAPRPDAAGDGS